MSKSTATVLGKTLNSKGVLEQTPKSKSVLEQAPKSKSVLEQAPKSKSVLEQTPKSKNVLPESKSVLRSTLTIKGDEEELVEKADSDINSSEELPQKPPHRHSKDDIISIFTRAMMEYIIHSWEMIPEEEKNELQETEEQDNVSIRRRSSNLRKLSRRMSSALSRAASQSVGVVEEDTAQASVSRTPQLVSSTAAPQQKSSHVKIASAIAEESEIEQDHQDSEANKSLSSQILEDMLEEEVHHSLQDLSFCSITKISDESNCLKDGNAVIVFTNGIVYEGHIKQSVMDGEGLIIWPDGSLYEGDFTTGQITGKGYIEWPDLSWYDGEVCLGYRHGLGMYRATFSDVTYSGKWYMGCKEGPGILYYSKNVNDHYNGEWVQNERHGLGMRSYPSHACYHGQWKHGLPHGVGTMIWPNNDLYQGSWENGKLCGYGEYTWSAFLNPNFVLPAENRYCGEWKNGKRCGNGNLNLRNGTCIKGQWTDGYKDGPGIIVYPNGTSINSDQLFHSDHLVKPETSELFTKREHSKNSKLRTTCYSSGKYTRSPGSTGNTRKTKCSQNKQVGSDIKAKNKSANSKLATTENCTNKLTSLQNVKIAEEVRNVSYNIKCIEISYHLARWIKFKYPELKFLVTDEIINEIIQHRCSQTNTNNEEEIPLKDTPNIYENKYEQILVNGMYTEIIKEIDNEKKWLYDALIYHLPYMKELYCKYGCMFSEEDTIHQPVVFRLLLWQLLRDCDVHKSVSLTELDTLFATNSSCLFESAHNPFEPIQMWQFQHILLDVSWILYTSKGMKEEGAYGELASGFQKFLINDVKPNTSCLNGDELLKYIHVLPLEPIYLLYRSIGEAHTARELLNYICGSEQYGNETINYRYSNMNSIASLLLLHGKNVFCNGHVIYLTDNKRMNFSSDETNMRPTATKYEENVEHKYSCFITPRMLVTSMASVCPQIQPTAQLICNMDYKLTFLEFYEIIVASALAIVEDVHKKGAFH